MTTTRSLKSEVDRLMFLNLGLRRGVPPPYFLNGIFLFADFSQSFLYTSRLVISPSFGENISKICSFLLNLRWCKATEKSIQDLLATGGMAAVTNQSMTTSCCDKRKVRSIDSWMEPLVIVVPPDAEYYDVTWNACSFSRSVLYGVSKSLYRTKYDKRWIQPEFRFRSTRNNFKVVVYIVADWPELCFWMHGGGCGWRYDTRMYRQENLSLSIELSIQS